MMQAALKMTFGMTAILLFGVAAVSTLVGTIDTPGFSPNDGHSFLLDTTGAALVAFIAAQLGLTVKAEGDRFLAKAKASMGGIRGGAMVLVIGSLLFLAVGVAFALLWTNPQWVAVETGADRLTEAPAFVAREAKTFVGVTLAALAAVGSSVAG